MTRSEKVDAGGQERRSCLYECRVLHHRFHPRTHRFEYGLFLLSLDLDELDRLPLRLLGRNRPNLYEFRDRDHLQFPAATPPGTAKASITAWLSAQGVHLPENARIQLITLPRVAGYIFNPVSFYFCQTAAGQPICAVTEVGNTFGELKPFLIPLQGTPETTESARFRHVVPKNFYVSPFSDLQVCFDFSLRWPDQRLEIHINDVTTDGQTWLVSTLTGRQRPLTDAELLRLTVRYPLVTLRVISLIHWQAFRLWWKRLPWYRKADHPEQQQGVFRPHASLAPLIVNPNQPAPTNSLPL